MPDIHLETMPNLQVGDENGYFGNERLLTLNASAFGTLRKDLILTLGMEQSKSFFLRYSYASGYHDAEKIKHKFYAGNNHGSYRLETLFHTLVGMAHITPLSIRSNNNEYLWPSEGIWHNSYEAEHHVKHFGPANEPVCWSLAGHASGFQSALSGEQIIYKEVSCAAKGDPYCRFVGKTLAEWGEEILPELRFYQEFNPGQRLECSYPDVQKQNELLKQTMAIHRQLTQMVLNGEDMQTITCAVGQIIDGTVIVEDQFFRLLAYYSQAKSKEKELPPYSARDIFNDWRYRQLATTLTQEKRSVLLPAKKANNPVSRFIAPVINGQKVLGYVNIIRYSDKFTETDQMIMDSILEVFALKMMEHRAVARVETRYMDDFVAQLISGNFKSDNSIIERACRLGYNLNLPHRVLIINFDKLPRFVSPPGRDERRYLYLQNQLIESIKPLINSDHRHGIATAQNDDIIIITTLTENDLPAGATDLAQDIQNTVSMKFPKITVSIGIGRPCHSPGDFPQSYQEAKRALKVIKGLNQKNAVISFDRLGTFGLLLNAANQQDLLTFMNEHISKLLEYDDRHQSQLVETLYIYFICNENIKEAARVAAVTPSGFKYRLGKICEVGGFSLKDPNKRFDLQMALKIWWITEECKPKKPVEVDRKIHSY